MENRKYSDIYSKRFNNIFALWNFNNFMTIIINFADPVFSCVLLAHNTRYQITIAAELRNPIKEMYKNKNHSEMKYMKW